MWQLCSADDKHKAFHDWSAERMMHQNTAMKEKEPGFIRYWSGLLARRFPRQPTLLTKNAESDKGENHKQRAQQKKIEQRKFAGYKIAKWIKTNYIRRKEELDARITDET